MNLNLGTTAVLLALLATPALAEAPRFAPIFGDHAVLQRDKPIALWGTAKPGESVTVEFMLRDKSLNFEGVFIKTTADATGRWKAALPAQTAGGPYALTATVGSESTTLNDILIGDVFLCSGQSNMEFTTKYATNAYNEINTSTNPNIRFVTINRDARPGAPLTDLPAAPAWLSVSPLTTGEASAVCYYMSKALHAETGAPVGMIHSSWGGSKIEPWISAEGLAALKSFDSGLSVLKLYGSDRPAAEAKWQTVLRDWWKDAEPDAPQKAQWSTPAFNDADWGTIDTSGVWENTGLADLKGFDGVVWYRTEVTLTVAQAKSATTIALGPVDDADTTWVNGKMVGATEGWDTPRTYAIPKNTLKAGRNVIVLRALDTGGGGGLWGDPTKRGLILADGSTVPLTAAWKYKISAPISALKGAPTTPWAPTSGLSTLYNGMIAPIAPYTLKGVAWYQGESNVGDPAQYARLLPALFADWRKAFQQSDLPFVVVQLADYGPTSSAPAPSGWAELRETQRRAVNADPKTALVVAIDIGDPVDIHPTQKKVVGDRAALGMLKAAYGQTVHLSPEPQWATRDGANLTVGFNSLGGLKTLSAATAIGFETCNAQKVCAYAEARVDGDTVILTNANHPEVRYIRYAWADSPATNLFNKDNLPVTPFEIEVK